MAFLSGTQVRLDFTVFFLLPLRASHRASGSQGPWARVLTLLSRNSLRDEKRAKASLRKHWGAGVCRPKAHAIVTIVMRADDALDEVGHSLLFLSNMPTELL